VLPKNRKINLRNSTEEEIITKLGARIINITYSKKHLSKKTVGHRYSHLQFQLLRRLG
jgi:hypothetical protein